jgi:hypothetical protein
LPKPLNKNRCRRIGCAAKTLERPAHGSSAFRSLGIGQAPAPFAPRRPK